MCTRLTSAGARASEPESALLLVLGAGLLVTVLLIVLLALGLSRSQLRRARQQAQVAEAMRKSEEQFRALIENTTDVFILTDTGGSIRYISPSVERILARAQSSPEFR